ncbi:ribulose-1,5 bisphosphate carboxylase/oxygenase large subunit N-methyltransferase, chloroplastic [Typha angustifolia]|uniref:ribulose-1,5 bisphosphate carboxylase/oxygenase large subunit N-methyltransferase, chloroplastic n=1 Tax=Typha angustifolia TaxID=59011 RepID=UPI003C2E1C83
MASLRLFSPPPSSSSPFFSNSPARSLSLQSRSISAHALLRTHQTPTFPSESTLQEFSQWLSTRGAVNSSSLPVKPSIVPEGLGLVAERNLPQNEVVVEIPKKLWIDSDAVAASEIGRVCGGLRPWVSIALFLLREKARGDDSPWRPYLDILPQETDSTIFWSEEELSEIQGTQLLSTTLGVKEYVQSEFAKVEDSIILPNKNLFPSTITFPDFLWAFGVLRSRAFSRMRGDNLALVPLADLVNHNGSITTEDTSWEIKGKGLFARELVFSLRTPVPVKSGEQVYIQYDLEKSNAELALDYGFIESRSDREAYTLTLEISESDPFYGDKLNIAESNGLGETAYFDIVLGSSLPPLVLPYLRLIALGGTDAFLLESIFSNSIWGHLELPVSPANEETICRVVRDACKSALSAYQTTVEEDEELMRSGNLDSRLRIAVGIRAGEKKVLQQIDDIFRERELELDGLEYYQERRLRDLGLACDQDDIIFWESR